MNRLLAVIFALGLTACRTPGQKRPDEPPPCVGGDCADETPSKTSYRKVTRDPDGESNPDVEVDPAGFLPFDPAVPSARLEDGENELEGVDSAIVFRGDFASAAGDEFAIVDGSSVEVRAVDGERIARRDVGPIAPDSVRAVRLVDERLELALRRDGPDGGVELVVLRVIGRAVAEVFTHPVEDSIAIDFVQRGEQKAIRVTRGDDPPTLHLWNRWEGVFRVPRTPPTAPRE